MSIRTWHTYLGILIAPSVLFFALTGAVQLFSLHESHGSYQPAALVEKLSALHRDQVFAQKGHDDDAHEHSHDQDDHEAAPGTGTVLLKWYFLVVALALSSSTLLGLWMAFAQIRRRRAFWLLLAVGTIVPAVLAGF
jgi:hypothetical protein